MFQLGVLEMCTYFGPVPFAIFPTSTTKEKWLVSTCRQIWYFWVWPISEERIAINYYLFPEEKVYFYKQTYAYHIPDLEIISFTNRQQLLLIFWKNTNPVHKMAIDLGVRNPSSDVRTQPSQSGKLEWESTLPELSNSPLKLHTVSW